MPPLQNDILFHVEKNSDSRKKQFVPDYRWERIIFFILIHALFVFYAYKSFTQWDHFLATIISYCTFGVIHGLGITMGAHRLFAHRTYKATLPVKIVLLLAQAYAGQNSMLVWVRDHRVHHKFSDTDADPHNSHRGFFFSHMGWLLMTKHPDVKRLGKNVDISDLTSDKLVMFQYKYLYYLFFLTNFSTMCTLRLIGFSWEVAFAEFIRRYITGLHFTWSVNSVAHFFGNKPYNGDIRPVESKLVSYMTGGEGWHNYHHTFPWDYKAAEFGNRLNMTSQLIEFCAKLGLVYDLKSATPEMINVFAKKKGDGTHHSHQEVEYKM